MSYQVLARKWRPKRFAELVGQEHVKSTLINALKMGRLHHAYLFTGTRGVGKTTIARIFAKSLNCEQGISAEPCGQCDTCLAIEQGHFVDLIEIDAASRTKVEDTREILDNVQYAPTRGRYKVYLIDEVHMLSRHSFNALLKTLEEPPEHVKFLLATTDPQKLPITILSRCLQFNLKALLRSEIKAHLSDILNQEQIEFDDDALSLLAKAADGSLRDALSLTDQAIAQSAGELRLNTVEQMLGTIDKQWSVKLLAHIVNHDGVNAMATVEDIARLMPDYRALTDELLSIFHLAAMTQLVPSAAQIDESLHPFITRLAQKLSAPDVQLYYQILLSGKKDLELAPDPRIGFEMLLLRLLAFSPVAQVRKPQSVQVSDEPMLFGSSALLEVPETKTVEPPLSQQQQTPVDSPSQSLLAAGSEIPKPGTAKSLGLASADDKVAAFDESKVASEDGLLDDETINAQQQSVYAAALSQGYQPVAEITQEQSLAIDDVSVEQQLQPQLQASAETETETGAETAQAAQVEAQPQPEFEDPVAAILANRNLSFDSMFSPTQAPSARAPQGNDTLRDVSGKIDGEAAKAQEGRAKKPEPLGHTEPVQPQTPQAVSLSLEPANSEPSDLGAESSIVPEINPAPEHEIPTPPAFSLASPELGDEQSNKQSDEQNTFNDQQADYYNDARFMADEPPINEQADFDMPPVDFWQQSAPEDFSSEQKAAIYQQDRAESQDEQHAQLASTLNDNSMAEYSAPPQVGNSLIDKDLPRWAHQVDEWANLIEQMGLGGLVRLLAVQSVYTKKGKTVSLSVHHSEKHLDSKGLRDQLQRGLSLALNEPIELELSFTEEILNTPLNIQRQIDADRLTRAKQLIYHDPLIIALQQRFAAQVKDESILPVG